MLSSFLSTFLYVFTSLVTVVNPIGAAMFFLTITSGATRAQRMTLSNKVCIYFLIMALVTLCAGSFVLIYLGVFRCADFLDGFLRIVADSSIVRAKINRT